jgi:hypothetical protein
MNKREADLKSLFSAELKRRVAGFELLQYSTNGAPDRSVVGLGRQTNWEFKHGTPEFDSPADQELICCRLAHLAHCRYVVWCEKGSIQRTMIVHPLKVRNRTSWNLEAEALCPGFDMRWLVERVIEAHRA